MNRRPNETEYGFSNSGIGKVLKSTLLKVPANQRPYAWKAEHVQDLLSDIKEAMTEETDTYFLGTVVLVEGEPRRLIADGQQRIATSSILLARCRDLLRRYGEKEDAESIETDFLRKYIRRSKEYEFVLSLNIEDDEYFRKIIIEPDWEDARPPASDNLFPSNDRLYAASQQVQLFLQAETSHLSDTLKVNLLNRWVSFLEDNAFVVAVTVPDEVGAFRMFETLNDRGLRASQADILKNYFFSKVKQSELEQIQAHWNQIYGSLADCFDNPDERMVEYIRYFWTLENGLTRQRELALGIKKKVRHGRQALTFVASANSAVTDFAAIFNSQHTKWERYGEAVRSDLSVLTDVINIEQIVPLVFAVAHKFSVSEAKKAFRLFVVWSVRFLLGGSGRAGRLDKQYADLAHAVGTEKITTARELRDALADKVPSDDAFTRAVASAKVSKSVLARYYLLSLERVRNPGSGELEPSTDVNKVNLEHVLPQTFTKDVGVSKADYDDLLSRLGNQTIMQSEWNRDIGNLPFREKKKTFAKSEISLTKDLARYSKFTRDEIDERQREMAELAPQVWSLKFG